MAAWERVRGDYFEWMFLGKERRRIPGWRRVVWKGPQQTKDILFQYVHKFNFLYFSKKFTFALIRTSPQGESDVPPALATFHQPLQAMSEIHFYILLLCLLMEGFFSLRHAVCHCLLNDSPPPFFVIQNALSTKILGQLRKNNIVCSLKMF